MSASPDTASAAHGSAAAGGEGALPAPAAPDVANLTMAWAGAIAAELVRSGVGDAVISPGSRSAPLALAFATTDGITAHTVLDERAAAFVGLGIARASGRPVALVCTSGSAPGHYLPAIIEAFYSQIPLVVLTADRPHELRECGSAQTVRQVGLFGGHVRLALELSAPAASDDALLHARALVCRAVADAAGAPAGPVHMNVPLTEPLDPRLDPDWPTVRGTLSLAALAGRPGGRPQTHAATHGPALPDAATLDRLADIVRTEPRGLLVAGPLGSDAASAVAALAAATGWALLADPLSGLRGPNAPECLVEAHDAVLKTAAFTARHIPRCVLRVGGMPTSKALRLLLEQHPETTQIVVDDHAWREPTARASEIVRADPARVAGALHARLAPSPEPSDFARAWMRAGRAAADVLAHELDAHASLSEPCVVRALARGVATDTWMCIASSMPIRDIDAFWPARAPRVRFLANRGANGIDGTLASAVGTAIVAAREGRDCVVLLGDLAFLHDVGSLLVARRSGVRATFVVVDNDGGGIFEHLPAAQSTPRPLYEAQIATPQGADLAAIAAGFGLHCVTARTADELLAALASAARRPGIHIVRVPVERREMVELHRKLAAAVSACLVADPTRESHATDARTTPAGAGGGSGTVPAHDTPGAGRARRRSRSERGARMGKRIRLRDGLHMAVHVRGDGPPLLLVHGFTGSRRTWPERVVTGLAAKHRVLVPDLIGHGSSARPHTPQRYAMHHVVDDLCGVLDAYGIERATWIGYSMGGRIVLGGALLRPERVEAIALESASAGLADPDERAAREASDDALAARLTGDGIVPFVRRWMAQPLFATQRRLPPAVQETQRTARLANDPRALAACLRGLGTGTQPSFWHVLPNVQMPVLLIAGSLDGKFRGISEQMAGAFPDACVEIVEGAGHATHLEAPDAYLAALARLMPGLASA
jgi:2-succinyl-5-enolpyruvyl-6-hydroxy-3-cyclohexene-1-carboxylate synthase